LPGGRARVSFDDRQAPVAKLADVGAGAGNTKLRGQTIGVRVTLVTALAIDGANLTFGAVRVVDADPLRRQLADVERTVARNASQTRGAILGRLALVVAVLKRADQRRVAIRVDGAPLCQIGKLRRRAGDAEHHANARNHDRSAHESAQVIPQFHMISHTL
jgi:hypothetical protein